ncbi:MAG TPA: ISL3 family transposase [Acidimicrobiales bacterium]|nr:ISL3 family transposase [Acidimicrobiales bacterium]
MRVTTAFNRMLDLAGASVVSVAFAEVGIVVGIRNTSRRLRCECGWSTRARYDTSVRRWRHVNLGKCRVWLEGEIRRLACKRCGRVRTEDVAWARPGARHTRDYEDIVAWLVQRTDKTTTATLMGCSWAGVDNIVERVVAEHLVDDRLDNLYRIGVDEISYRRGHQYLTIIADHDGGGVVWIAKGKRGKALEDFYAELGEERRQQLEAVSMDLGTIYHHATRRCVPHAVVCFDPFHVIQIANRALDAVYMSVGRSHPTGVGDRSWRNTRFALRAGAEHLDDTQRELLRLLRRDRRRLWRAWELKEELRDLYRRVDPTYARAYLKQWITRALRSRIPAFVNLAGQIRAHFEGIVAAVELGLSNARLEGINSKIRLIQRRGHGYHSVQALAAVIYLCLGGITIELPTRP